MKFSKKNIQNSAITTPFPALVMKKDAFCRQRDSLQDHQKKKETSKEDLSLGVTEHFIFSQLAKNKAPKSSFRISITYLTG